jgi:CheY-like chemotaxis protein/Tfp pilus assembly protein PilF
MASVISDKKSKILVVEASASVRQMMSDVARTSLGYESVEGMASVSDALKYLEVEQANWVILPLLGDQPTNALHLLRVCTEHRELNNVRVSLYVGPDEVFVLPTAFSLGLLSYHNKPFTKESFVDDMKKLLSTLERDSFNETLTSARYLREMLKLQNDPYQQLDLEQGLLNLYPGNPNILLNMVEPQFHLGNQDAAKALLHQVKMLDESLTNDVNNLAQALMGESLGSPSDSGTGENVLGLKSCVVIDSDEAVRREISDIFGSLGVQDIKAYANGEDAWTSMKDSPEPDLIVMEWRIPKVSGPVLLQRVRNHGFLTAPIVVISSLIKNDDLPLIKEMGIANLIQKPVSRSEFLPSIIKTIRQERLPTEHQVLERKLRQLIQAGKDEDAAPLLARFLGDPSVPLGRKRLVEAEQAFAKGNYSLARYAGIQSLKYAGDSLLVLNLLGKAFMHLKDHMSALKCFKRAQELSPNNLERLCNIAESQAELGDHDAARDTLEGAKTIDANSQSVNEAEAKVAIASGDTESAKEILTDMGQIASLVSYMNNKAVAYAKCGYTQEAVEIYERTIASVPEKDSQTKAVVTYNLSLCLIKMNELEKACTKLSELAKVESRITKKAASLADRLKKNLEAGTEFKLRTAEPSEKKPETESTSNNQDHQTAKSSGSTEQQPQSLSSDDAVLASEQDYRDMLAAVELKKGDLCCFLIFMGPTMADPKTTSLLAKPPRFQRRDAIEKPSLKSADSSTAQSA